MSRRRTPRWALGLLALALVLTPPAALGAGISQVDLGAASRVCADGKSIHARLGARDLAYLSRLAPCLLRTERRQIGRGYTANRKLSGLIAGTLRRFVGLSYLLHGQSAAATRASVHDFGVDAARACHARTGSKTLFIQAVADTHPPPVLTPLTFAGLFAKSFRYKHGVALARRTVFGAAVVPGLLFRNHDRNGAGVAMVGALCPRS